VIFAAVFGVHLLLMAYAFPVADLLGDRPYASPDYQTHFRQTTMLTRVLDEHGKLWGYDPGMLAGHPVGLIFDVDNKLHFLFSYALHKAGLPLGAAFNLFTFVTCLLAPLSLWLAARMFRLAPREQLVALAFGILLWHLDSAASAWRGGMVSFCMVSHGSIAVLGLYYRMLDPDEPRRWRYLLALLLLLPLNLLTHVWSFAILVVPMVGLYLYAWRRRMLGTRGHLMVWGLAAFSLAANLHWLAPALLRYELIAPSGVVGQANPLYIISDWFGLLVDPINTGFSIPHTLFRFAAICAAALTLWGWRRKLYDQFGILRAPGHTQSAVGAGARADVGEGVEQRAEEPPSTAIKQRDPRFFIAALSLGYLFGMAYIASLIPVLRETEPYRFVLPASLLAGVFGAPWWARVLSREQWRALSRPARVLVVVLVILLIPRVAEHVTYFIPELAPAAKLPPIVVHRAAAAPTSVLPSERKDPDWLPRGWRLRGVSDGMMQLADHINKECKEEGRLLVQHWAIAEFLGWATDRPIIGGFPDRRLIHEAANVLRRPTDPRFHGKELADYLARYNIRYVITTDPVPALESRRDLMVPLKLLFPNRIYKVRHNATYVARGQGKVKATLNRIEVTGARPAPGTQAILLRFHHMDSLRCRPRCEVLQTPIPHDPAGFITVVGKPRLPERFVIEHHY
jgi:hypothetical protein